MKLTANDRRDLRRYSDSLKGSYCQGVLGCTGCKDKCPNGVAVHEINRCLGYAVGYGDIRLARENFNELPIDLEVCADCGECRVNCINGLNLTSNINRARSFLA
jgi:predicted aldo/keto reductase-like oxidoreductase